MKKLSLLFFFLLFFLTGCGKEASQNADLTGRYPNGQKVETLTAIKNRGKIIVGTKIDSKPFCFLQNNELAGFDVDIAKNIAKRIFLSDNPKHIQFVPLKPYQRIGALNVEKVDIIVSTLSINRRRKDIIDFSIPYFETGQALMVKNNSKINSIENFKSSKLALGVVLSTTGEKAARILVPDIMTVGSETYQDAFQLLKEGSIDGILADDSLLYGFIADNRGYKILPKRYTKEYYAVGLRQGKENASLKAQIDSCIAEMQSDGSLNKIRDKWLPKSSVR